MMAYLRVFREFVNFLRTQISGKIQEKYYKRPLVIYESRGVFLDFDDDFLCLAPWRCFYIPKFSNFI